MLLRNRSLWHRAMSLALIMLLLSTQGALAAGSSRDSLVPNLTAPQQGEVLINEFVANNGTVQTSEWVELYNTTSGALDISLMWIDDIAAGGGAPETDPGQHHHRGWRLLCDDLQRHS